tara:strand:- start:468 stop:698 length:231 start_codon:yes stop_codon:yes gene_type:complete
MALEVVLVCEESADAYTVQLLSIVLAIVFGLYILFDTFLGAFTVGAKAYQLLNSDLNFELQPTANIKPKAFDAHVQ